MMSAMAAVANARRRVIFILVYKRYLHVVQGSAGVLDVAMAVSGNDRGVYVGNTLTAMWPERSYDGDVIG
jgi:hypothetical protein